MTNPLSWIAVDWGTSNLRAWLMGSQRQILSEHQSERGMAALAPDEFESALLELIGGKLPLNGNIPVLCCGMAGARQGWREAPYAAAPCAPPGVEKAVHFQGHDNRLRISILPGVQQIQPPDVMRGEETQIRGFLAVNPGFEGCLCLPGTHAKWVRIADGKIHSFQTMMTGELFALLARQSVLKHSVNSPEIDQAAFTAAVQHITSAPERLAGELFRIRAAGLAGKLESDAGRGRLSGLLIGSEIAAAKQFWQQGSVTLIGDDKLSRLYCTALEQAGVRAAAASAAGLTLQGLCDAFEEMQPS